MDYVMTACCHIWQGRELIAVCPSCGQDNVLEIPEKTQFVKKCSKCETHFKVLLPNRNK